MLCDAEIHDGIALELSCWNFYGSQNESHGDWWAVEFGSDAVKALKSHFGVSGIPMLVVPNKDIELVTKE